MSEMESLDDGSAIANSDHFNFQLQSSIFETPPSILAPPDYSSNLFNSPLLAPHRSNCGLCRSESRTLLTTTVCSHHLYLRYCESCMASITEHGCPSCIADPQLHLAQLRLSPTHLNDKRTESNKTLPRLDSYSIWGSNPTVWDNSNKSLHFESNQSLDTSDPSGLFSPTREGVVPPSTFPCNVVAICATCGEDTRATHFCSQCKDLLCPVCVEAHARVRVTKDHIVMPISNSSSPSLNILPPSLMVNKNRNGDDGTNSSCSTLCSIHESKLIGICEWCKCQALCSSCLCDHGGHKIVPIGDIRCAMIALLADSRQEEKRIDEGQEGISRMIERVDASVQAVASELRSVMHMHISALEERKRELLSLVETTRISKMKCLSTQSETLNLHKNRLQQMAQMGESVRDDDDNHKLGVLFEKMVELYSIPRIGRQTNETDSIKFLHPDPNLLAKLRGLGGLESGPCARNSQILGEGFRRAIRERQTAVTVQLKDACNQICRTKGQSVEGTVIAPNGNPLDVSISERDGGVVVLSYIPLQDGPHTLNITLRGTSINGCPTQVDVRRGRNYEEICNQGELFSFGREGSGDGELCRPWGICCDLLGRILVADRSNNRIQIFDKDGHFITKFGSAGTRAGQFDRPAGLTTNTLNQIIVADKDNHRIQVFDQDGTFILKFGERGRPVGMFNYPWGVATNNINNIAVSDTRNHRVQIFTAMGQFIRKCGFDSAYFYKHLDSPRGLCYLPDGQLLITDFNNHRLAVLSSSRSSPDMKCYGSEGETTGLFCRPQGVKTDPEGHILVCDSRNNRVQIFCGDDMRCVASFGGISKTNGFQMPQELPTPLAVGGSVNAPPPLFAPQPPKPLLDRPTDVCVSPEGRIYVVDFGNNCIRVF